MRALLCGSLGLGIPKHPLKQRRRRRDRGSAAGNQAADKDPSGPIVRVSQQDEDFGPRDKS
jgi:hypothetical protein